MLITAILHLDIDMSRTEEDLKRWQMLSQLSDLQLLKALRFQEEDGWQEVVQQLHQRGGQLVFDFSKELAYSSDCAHQVVGVRILGQLGGRERPYKEASISILKRLINSASPEVQAEVIVACGHLKVEQLACELMLKIDSEDDLIRRSLAFAFGQFGGKVAADALGYLIADKNEEVVEWALLGLQDEHVATDKVKRVLAELRGSMNAEIAAMASEILKNASDAGRGN